jgi:uncharacterized protein (TIGR04222 family)
MQSEEVPLMASVSDLDVYEIAYLCGGPERVALTAVAAMARDGRIKISRTRHRVQVVHRWGGQPAERSVPDAVPDSGKVLGPLLADVAHSAVVADVPSDQRVAMLGTAGIADAGLRGIFEAPDPPPGGKLVPRTRRHGYDEVPPDPPIPMHPGISGRW